jgi:hypothetical protein
MKTKFCQSKSRNTSAIPESLATDFEKIDFFHDKTIFFEIHTHFFSLSIDDSNGI